MNIRTFTAASLAAIAGLAHPALAQNALDRNLQVGSGGVNPARPSFADEVRFRNAIVTGNVPGGFSFRGDVGYRAPGEFQGRLGSDATFAFRRDAYYSGLGGLGIRGTEALQYQFAMTTGNAPPPSLGISPEFWRAGAQATARAVSAEPSPRGISDLSNLTAPPAGPQAGDDRGLSLLSLRAPSSFAANRGLQPVTLNVGQAPDGTYRALTASVLRGVTLDGIPQTPAADPFGRPRPETQPEETRPPSADPASDPRGTGAPPVRTAYEDLMQRFQAAAAETPARTPGVPFTPGATEPGAQPDIPEWERRLNELRGQLGSPTATDPASPTDPSMRPPGSDPTAAPRPGPAGDTKPDRKDGKDRKDESTRDPDRDLLSGLRPETMEMIKRAGGQVTVLAQPGFDAYGTQMAAGQKHLASGRFFDAEERFTAALGAKPRDPMASIGRVHAMIGSGMFMSAAMSLRSLLAERPELAAVKYGPDLLPTKDRSAMLIERLGELAAAPGRGRDAAILLAYLGYQTGDEKAVARGLELMGKPGEGGIPAAGDETTRLAALLRELWIKTPAFQPGVIR